MISLSYTPPPIVQQELAALNTALDATIPAKTQDNILIGTWNMEHP
jgi:hypothetical protein